MAKGLSESVRYTEVILAGNLSNFGALPNFVSEGYYFHVPTLLNCSRRRDYIRYNVSFDIFNRLYQLITTFFTSMISHIQFGSVRWFFLVRPYAVS